MAFFFEFTKVKQKNETRKKTKGNFYRQILGLCSRIYNRQPQDVNNGV
jgi:hypothetical protein